MMSRLVTSILSLFAVSAVVACSKPQESASTTKDVHYTANNRYEYFVIYSKLDPEVGTGRIFVRRCESAPATRDCEQVGKEEHIKIADFEAWAKTAKISEADVEKSLSMLTAVDEEGKPNDVTVTKDHELFNNVWKSLIDMYLKANKPAEKPTAPQKEYTCKYDVYTSSGGFIGGGSHYDATGTSSTLKGALQNACSSCTGIAYHTDDSCKFVGCFDSETGASVYVSFELRKLLHRKC